MSIVTFRQYVTEDRRRVAAEYNLARRETLELYPDHLYTARWWDYVLAAFETGEDFTPQGLAKLTPGQLRDLSRTTRSLRNGTPRAICLAGNRLAR